MIRVFSSKTGTVLREWDWHGHIPNYSIVFSSLGKRILTTSSYINIWDSDQGTVLNSGFAGHNKDFFEDDIKIVPASDGDRFVAVKKGSWQVWSSKDARLLLQSKGNFKGSIASAITNNGDLAAFFFQKQKQGYLEIYDLQQLKRTGKFSISTLPAESVYFSPDKTRLLIYMSAMNTIMVPIEPYRALYLPKLFTKNEKLSNNSTQFTLSIRPKNLSSSFSKIFLKIDQRKKTQMAE